jgi:hypothetical protein
LANHTPDNPVDLWPDCPAGFSELIMQMLEKEPQKRPQDCQEIAGKLKQIVESLS